MTAKTSPQDNEAALAELDIRLTDLSPEAADAQPFGLIRLDRRGRVLSYNTYEERLAKLARADVLGKNFFFEIAPCTRVREFYGRFLDGVERGALRTTFGFVFPFPHGEREVRISMLMRPGEDAVWVVVQGG